MRCWRFVAVVLGGVALAVAGAIINGPPPSEDLGEGKVGAPTAYHGLGWLVEECPALDDATAVVFYGGYLANEVDDPRALIPYQHSHWRDHVVTLPEDAVSGLVEAYDLEISEGDPDVVPLLDAELPDGILLRSDELDGALCKGQYVVLAWVSVEHDQVVLTVIDF